MIYVSDEKDDLRQMFKICVSKAKVLMQFFFIFFNLNSISQCIVHRIGFRCSAYKLSEKKFILLFCSWRKKYQKVRKPWSLPLSFSGFGAERASICGLRQGKPQVTEAGSQPAFWEIPSVHMPTPKAFGRQGTGFTFWLPGAHHTDTLEESPGPVKGDLDNT